MLNQAVLIGRLTHDPDLRFSASGTAIARFALAVETGFGDKKQTDFIPIVAFGKTGEACGNYLKKGRLAAVAGRIQARPYLKDGQKRYATEIVANEVKFLERGDRAQTEQPPADDYSF